MNFDFNLKLQISYESSDKSLFSAGMAMGSDGIIYIPRMKTEPISVNPLIFGIFISKYKYTFNETFITDINPNPSLIFNTELITNSDSTSDHNLSFTLIANPKLNDIATFEPTPNPTSKSKDIEKKKSFWEIFCCKK